MAALRLHLSYVLLTVVIFLLTLVLNTLLFKAVFEHTPGIAWVYLPAGVRLLCTLLFAEAGGIGLLLASLLVNHLYFFPLDPARAIAGAFASALAPWLTYRAARQAWGLQASLQNLSPTRLLVLAVAYSVASPALHHVYIAWEDKPGLAGGFVAMVVGDLVGTLMVLYSIRWALSRWTSPMKAPGSFRN
ncbi:hypothetical protein [Ramlibacter rhizophilus]|uniref:MASE1 domain-containing protein n=1 Tax=Ramlibacter rhizophilus TaxID=1781167 RepID=A0A4Z0BI65_9BURK|nr:hypothetical protein [Ramlibacter rhizophilus]TFY97957.1 hypothetical protein EZ242_16030 [Ramlibacter rhizophilus]